MVDPVSSAAINSLIRTQTTTSAGIAALKSNQQAQQAIIDQLQKGLDQNKVLMNQPSAPAPAQGSSTLPRGSLVDVYA
jgi:hypothetical protein